MTVQILRARRGRTGAGYGSGEAAGGGVEVDSGSDTAIDMAAEYGPETKECNDRG
jgi:hypothetical protein